MQGLASKDVLLPALAAPASTNSPLRYLHPPRNGQRFRGGLVFKAHRLCVSLNSRLESNNEEKKRSSTPPLEHVPFALAEGRIRLCHPRNGWLSRR